VGFPGGLSLKKFALHACTLLLKKADISSTRLIRDRRIVQMSIARRLGVLVFFGVPAIIGGGIVYALFDYNYVPVAVYEIMMLSLAGAIISR
jgi:hypothetical protein